MPIFFFLMICCRILPSTNVRFTVFNLLDLLASLSKTETFPLFPAYDTSSPDFSKLIHRIQSDFGVLRCHFSGPGDLTSKSIRYFNFVPLSWSAQLLGGTQLLTEKAKPKQKYCLLTFHCYLLAFGNYN